MPDILEDLIQRIREHGGTVDVDAFRSAMSGISIVRQDTVAVIANRLGATVDAITRTVPCTKLEIRCALVGVLEKLTVDALKERQAEQQGVVINLGQLGGQT